MSAIDAYVPYQRHGLWSPPSARVADAPRETMRGIITNIALEYGLTYEDLIGRSRFARIVRARHDAVHECWLRRRWSTPQIGKAFGDRDHTTVLHGVRAHRRRLGL
jgi:chromosomal replication initiation ATPase DnaA